MKWLVSLLALALISYGFFAAYRVGLERGRKQGLNIAPALAEGTRLVISTEIGATVGHAELWEGMTREQFQERMERRGQRHRESLRTAFAGLASWQREAVIAMLWDSLSEDEERQLRSIPLPKGEN